MRGALSLVVVACLAVTLHGAAGAAVDRPIRVTFVGDSVAASIAHAPAARALLRRHFRVTLNLAVCRRLVAASCTHEGTTPATALQAVRRHGRSLGDVLIVKVGYNESAHGYREGIDRVMRAALGHGVDGVVWVTLRETSGTYREMNVAIRTAAARWPQLVVADWNAYSSGRAWFGSDGLHLTGTGANALAGFLGRYVREAAGASSA
jgi:hypothetical protein